MVEKKNTITLAELLEAKDVNSKISELSYEEALSLVEELLNSVERGNLSLEQSITSYEKGVALLAHLRKLLSGAEARLNLLKESEGELKITPAEID